MPFEHTSMIVLVDWLDFTAYQPHDCFARCPDLPLHEFRSYLPDLPHLRKVEAAHREGMITECEVCDALKQVSLNKSPGLDGLPYEVYLRLPCMFVPILFVPGSITRAVVQVRGKRSGAFTIEQSVRQGGPCLLFMSSLESPCAKGLGMSGQIWPYTVSLLLPLLQQRSLHSLISLSLHSAAWT